jgi:translation elongation factor EF-1alpha
MWSDDEEVTAVGPGENVKIKLKGIEEDDVSPGFVLCDNANPIKTGRVFDAQVRESVGKTVVFVFKIFVISIGNLSQVYWFLPSETLHMITDTLKHFSVTVIKIN